MIKIAIATAHVLGLIKVKINNEDLPTTAHFMTVGKCLYDCSFCTQARSSKQTDQYLSRVIWPEFEEDNIKEIMKEKLDKNFKRICLQVTQSSDYLNSTIDFIKYIKKVSSLPLSISIRPRDLKEVKLLFKEGINQLGLALDIVGEKDYKKIKKGNYHQFLKFLFEAGRLFPGKITTHLIIGFNETEKQVIKLLEKLYRNRINVALFAFTPVQGTVLSFHKPPNITKYRRIQLAQFLVTNRLRYNFRFDKQGDLISIGWKKKDLLEKLWESNIFQTSGCHHCNRPYYNERPGSKLYNYHCKLTENELKWAIKDLNLNVK